MFDYSAVYLWCSIAFCRKMNCSPFLLNKPLVNITDAAVFLPKSRSIISRVQVFDGAEAPALDDSDASGRGAPGGRGLHVQRRRQHFLTTDLLRGRRLENVGRNVEGRLVVTPLANTTWVISPQRSDGILQISFKCRKFHSQDLQRKEINTLRVKTCLWRL